MHDYHYVRQAGWQHSCCQLLIEGTAEPYWSVVRVGKSTLDRDGLTLPKVSDYLVQLCRFLHLMNASLVTGRLKWNDQKVAKLSTHMPFWDDPFVQIWVAFWKIKNQGICLACIFRI